MNCPGASAFARCASGLERPARRSKLSRSVDPWTPGKEVAMLAQALAPKFLVLYAFLLSALFVHFRGKVRHRFTRQLTDHSTLFAPINALLYAFSAVPNKPFLDV